MAPSRHDRREFLKLSAAGVIGYSMSGWLQTLANAAAADPQRRKSCILLWMNGGPSQMDTFDLKPGHVNGGPFREISTSVPGMRISEHLPTLAGQMRDVAIIRSMTSREGDHGRATFLLRTGYLPQGPIQYPTLGSLVSKELGASDAPLPNFVSIASNRLFNQGAYGPGFLGPQHAPLLVGDVGFRGNQPNMPNDYEQELRVQNLTPPADVVRPQLDARISLLDEMERDFGERHPGVATQSHRTAYDRAVRLMRTAAAGAFQLDDEPARIRDLYGRNLFGQGCLLARRLVERQVPFVEVSLGSFGGGMVGWDTHADNFNNVRRLSAVLDSGWGTLMSDLRTRGLLDSTLIVWMGEFGRTPRINGQNGRDHYPNAWSAVLAGGGIRGGQVVGGTSADGTTVEAERPTNVPDLLATVCRVLGIDPTRQNMSNVGRPIRIVDNAARPIRGDHRLVMVPRRHRPEVLRRAWLACNDLTPFGVPQGVPPEDEVVMSKFKSFMRGYFAFVALGLLLPLALLEGSAAAQNPPKPAKIDEPLDLVFFGDKHPVLIRIHVLVDGKTTQAHWNEYIEKWFRYLDVDKDGLIDAEEIYRAPGYQAMLQLMRQGVVSSGTAASCSPWRNFNKEEKDKLTLADLQAHYRWLVGPGECFRR